MSSKSNNIMDKKKRPERKRCEDPCSCSIMPNWMVQEIMMKKAEDKAKEEQASKCADITLAKAAATAATRIADELAVLEEHLAFQVQLEGQFLKKPQRLEANFAAASAIPADLSEPLAPFEQRIYDMQKKLDSSLINLKSYNGFLKVPGILIDPSNYSKDKHAQTVYDNTKIVYQFYEEVLGRKSVDNQNLALISSVHFGDRLANAFWATNEKQMIYGDGNRLIGENFTQLHIVAHEITHGLVGYTTSMHQLSGGENGALNESFGDIFGVVISQWVGREAKKPTTDPEDWFFGKELGVDGGCMRSLSKKGVNNTDNSPRSKQELEDCWDKSETDNRMYNKIQGDFDGLHFFCSIPSYAFYLFWSKIQDKGILPWELPIKVWFDALQACDITTDFEKFARLSVKSVDKLDNKFTKHLKEAWTEIGYLTTDKP